MADVIAAWYTLARYNAIKQREEGCITFDGRRNYTTSTVHSVVSVETDDGR